MSASENLVAAYGAWEDWTRREGQAIQDGNWVQVGECQRHKAGLQERILRCSETASAERVSSPKSNVQSPGRPSVDSELSTLDFGLETILERLILLERRNHQLVAERRQAAESQKAEVENKFRNLRRVKSSYAPPSRVAWHSYS